MLIDGKFEKTLKSAPATELMIIKKLDSILKIDF